MGGIVVGLVFFIIVLVILNYTNIINLSDILHKNSSVKLPSAKPSQGPALAIQDKLKKAGYDIVWVEDRSDPTGRTILASNERQFNGFSESFGWTNSTSYTDPKKLDYYRAMGIFKGWENIPNSKDKYIVLTNPNSKEEIGVRIMIDKNSDGMTTGLFVDDLSNGPKKQSVNALEKFDSFSNISSSVLNTLFKTGDVVTVYTLPLSIEEKPTSNFQAKRDANLKPIALSVVIRRFGGKEEVKNEIQ